MERHPAGSGCSSGHGGVFSAPLSAVLLGGGIASVRVAAALSSIPVALASATAGVIRRLLFWEGSTFPVALTAYPSLLFDWRLRLSWARRGACWPLLTLGVYAAEDLFQKLPIHWMWWPAIGGVLRRPGRTHLSAGAGRRI